MNALPKFKIASPCHARWEDMKGDEQSRFCGQCEKRVYNFSKMNPDEIAQLVSTNGKLCARFYQRVDGTVLLENCPVGAERVYRKVKIAVCSTVALFVFGMGVCFASYRVRSHQRSETFDRIEAKWDEAVQTVKVWMGIQTAPPIMGKMLIGAPLMGEVCVLPPTVTTNTVPDQTSNEP